MFTEKLLFKGILLSIGGGIFISSAHAQNFDPAIDGLIRNQERQAELEKIIQPSADVNLDAVRQKENLKLHEIKEEKCFDINKVKLNGEMSDKFSKYLTQALKELEFKSGMCMGEQAINLLMTKTQNIIIGRGYTTTRILVAPQNLSTGKLELTVIPGLVREIKLDLSDEDNTRAGRIQYAKNIFPIKNGDVLNLRDLEQGLENLKRVPTTEADIQIVPADAPNQSDVIVKWKQRKIPIRVTLSADDAGSRQTGKYQGNITASLDNPLFRSDLFYITVGRNLADQQKITDQNGTTVESGTNNYALHYSVPYKNWLISANASQYKYDQAVAGANNVYNYNGESKTQDLGVTRLLYRDAKRKTSASFKGWHRESKSFIDDAEMSIQRRDVSGWQFNIDHREYIKSSILDLSLGYKRGTGAFSALRAPEEAFDEGSSRMKIWTLDANLNVPFQFEKQNYNYSSSIRAQYNDTPLTMQDRMSIGGRYTVRGFDGNMTLAADRGYYWRNDLAMSIFPAHQFYIALDAGHVDGQSAEWLLGKTLIGGAMGFRGQFTVGWSFYYDVFAGKPIKKPEYFQTYDMNYGFSVNYSF